MSNIDKPDHSEEKIINEPAPAPTAQNQVAECEMDALLLGRIGVFLLFFFMIMNLYYNLILADIKNVKVKF